MPLRRLLLAALVSCLAAPHLVSARVQGARGRRLEVLRDMTPYRGGELILEPAGIRTSWDVAERPRHAKLVAAEDIRRYADQFLHTRLRVLPWDVRVERHVPIEPTEGRKALRARPSVTYQVSGHELLLGVDFVDARTGDLVAASTGFGRSMHVNGYRRGARDDLQEISRVLAGQLAGALGVRPPRRTGPHYRKEPYTRRSSAPPPYRASEAAPVGRSSPASPSAARRPPLARTRAGDGGVRAEPSERPSRHPIRRRARYPGGPVDKDQAQPPVSARGPARIPARDATPAER